VNTTNRPPRRRARDHPATLRLVSELGVQRRRTCSKKIRPETGRSSIWAVRSGASRDGRFVWASPQSVALPHTQLPRGHTPAPPDDGRSTADQQFSSCRCCTSRAGGTTHVRILPGAQRTFESCRAPAVPTTATDHGWPPPTACHRTMGGHRLRPRCGPDRPQMDARTSPAGLDRGGSESPQRTPPRRPDTNVTDLRSTGPNRDEPGRKSGAAVDNISSPLDAVLQICSR
jgi:hypothetical protein